MIDTKFKSFLMLTPAQIIFLLLNILAAYASIKLTTERLLNRKKSHVFCNYLQTLLYNITFLTFTSNYDIRRFAACAC